MISNIRISNRFDIFSVAVVYPQKLARLENVLARDSAPIRWHKARGRFEDTASPRTRASAKHTCATEGRRTQTGSAIVACPYGDQSFTNAGFRLLINRSSRGLASLA